MSKILIKFTTLVALAFMSHLCLQAEDTITIIGREFDEIEVIARVEQPTDNKTEINKQELNLTNIGQNLPFLLTTTPSLVVMSDDGLGIGYTYFRVRGTDQSRINMTINDVPLNDQESQTVFWVNMTDVASSMNKLNIQRGVGTSTNGSAAFGASVNMSTFAQNTEPNEFQVSFNGGMYNTFKESASARVSLKNKWQATARFSKVNSDGYLERAFSDLYSYYGSIGYFGNKTKVNLSVFGGKEKTYMAWDGVSWDDILTRPRYNPAGKYTDDNGEKTYYPNQTDNYAQQHTQLNFSQKLTQQLFLDITAHYTHGGGYYEQYKADKKFTEYALQPYTIDINGTETSVEKSDFIRQKHMNNHFYGGVLALKYISEYVDAQVGGAANNYTGQHWGKVIFVRDSLYPYKVDYNHEYYRNKGEKFDANIYAKANWRIINKHIEELVLYGDLQYRYLHYTISGINGSDKKLRDINVNQHYHFFNPKAGITYRYGNHNTYFNFAIANREPVRDNFTYAGENELPQAERLYDYELGYNYTHQRFHIGCNLYFMDYDNQLVLTGKYSDTGEYLTKNVKDSYRMGIELTAGVDILKWMRWDGNITLSRNRILNFTDVVTYYDTDYNWIEEKEVNFGNVDIAFSPNITANSLFTFSTHGFLATIQTNVVSKQYLDNSQNETATLKPYTFTNVNLQYTLPLAKRYPDIKILCQLNNIFNSRYAANGGSDMACWQGTTTACWPWYYAQAGINVHGGFVITL